MRSILTFVLALVAIPLTADTIRFDPPNPTSRTPVMAYLTGSGCGSSSGSAVRNGSSIGVAIRSQGCGFPVLGGYDVPVDLGILPAGVYDVVARLEGVPTPVAEVKLPVADAVPPFAVQPNVSHEGGEVIRLRRLDLIGCTAGTPALVCEDVAVRIDGVAAEVISVSPHEVIVRAPAHAAGTVDVELTTPRGTSRSVAALHYYDAAFRQPRDPAFFERVLFPVLYSGAGSYGSQWRTDLALHNGNTFEVEADTLPIGFICSFTCVTRLGPDYGEIIHGFDWSTGYVAELPRQAMAELRFSLVVRDLSRDASAFGTSVPVVRGKDWFDRPFSIVNVPSDPKNRVALRLYASQYISEARMNIVALTGPHANTVLVYAIEYPKAALGHNFAFIGDLLTKYPEIAGKGPLRLDILTATPAWPLWAYVSVTNNDTQNVIVIAPE